MDSLPPLRTPARGEGLRPGAARSDQLAHLSPGAPYSQVANDRPLDFLHGLIERGDGSGARFSSRVVPLDRVFAGCNFGDFRLLGFGERICHEARVEVNTPILNGVLTGTQDFFNMVLKPRALHRLRPQQPLHRLHPTNENGPSRGTPLPGQGLTNRF